MKNKGKTIESKVEGESVKKIVGSDLIGYSVNKSNATKVWSRIAYNRVTNFRHGNSPGCTPYDKK